MPSDWWLCCSTCVVSGGGEEGERGSTASLSAAPGLATHCVHLSEVGTQMVRYPADHSSAPPPPEEDSEPTAKLQAQRQTQTLSEDLMSARQPSLPRASWTAWDSGGGRVGSSLDRTPRTPRDWIWG